MVIHTPATDEHLRRWQATHDDAAFREVMTAWLPLVRSVCHRVLDRSDLAEDAVQETFLSLANGSQQIRGHLGSWLYRTALNHAIDLRRSELARRQRERTWASDTAVDELSEVPAEHEFLIEECLGELDEGQRAMIDAYFFQNRSQYDIATEYGVSQVAIKKRIDRAMTSLRLKLLCRGFDLAVPQAGKGRNVSTPLIIPLGGLDAVQVLGWSLLIALLLRPREGLQRITEITQITGGLVCSLVLTTPDQRSSALNPRVQIPWWVRSMRGGVMCCSGLATIAAVLVGRR
jgi:RNA polymerase sigma factor (sigma-70 family)